MLSDGSPRNFLILSISTNYFILRINFRLLLSLSNDNGYIDEIKDKIDKSTIHSPQHRNANIDVKQIQFCHSLYTVFPAQ